MSVRDLYQVLGVPRDASAATIRRAYKDKCLRVHPDKQPAGAPRAAAEALFKELAAAYATLSEPGARAAHDAALGPAPSPFADTEFQRQFAADFERKIREEGGVDFDGATLFDALFGERRAKFGFQEPAPPPRREKAPDREVELPLTLEEIHFGCVKRRRLHKVAHSEKTGLYSKVATIMRIDIKPGYRPGDKVRFRDAGDESADRRPPDVVFVISQVSHPRFTRHGDDLHVVVSLGLAEALTGANVTVDGIDGKAVQMTLDHVVKPGSMHTVEGGGLSRRGAPVERGNLVVKFAVVFPERLLPSEKGMLKDVFARISAKEAFPSMRRSASLFMNRTANKAADNGAQSEDGGTAKRDRAMHAMSEGAEPRPAPRDFKRTASLSNTQDMEDAPSVRAMPNRKPKNKGRFATFFR